MSDTPFQPFAMKVIDKDASAPANAANFDANVALKVTIDGTVYYIPANTATW